MHNLEDILASEIERQGVRASPDGFRQMLTECIGRMNSVGFISLDSGSISLPDYVRSCRSTRAELFESASAPVDKETGNLTEQMSREIADTRSRSLPSDWEAVRSRHTGLTRQYMNEIAATRKGESVQ